MAANVPSKQSDFSYIGQELDLFAHARNWKAYWGAKVRPYLGKTVLEVGAGIGGTTHALVHFGFERWLGIEPDGVMAHDLQKRLAAGEFPSFCEFSQATVSDLAAVEKFDTILYIDVLEHIEADAHELARAVHHLNSGGYLIVLSPAFQYLYSEFDREIGHCRRYTRRMLRAIAPDGVKERDMFYLDSVGMCASVANKLFLHASQPTLQQILFWDGKLVPLGRILDPLIGYQFGRSIIGVWQRDTIT